MTAAEFRRVFDSVADDYGLSAESRAQAWKSAHAACNSLNPLNAGAVAIYRALAATKPPFRPSALPTTKESK